MIQLNLLPDVKLKYIKARRAKRLVVVSSLLISAAMLVLVGFTFTFVQGLQRKNIRDLTADIAQNVLEIQSIQDLDKILTVQNQLGTLPELHESKLIGSRLFNYVNQTTPNDVSITRIELDVETEKIIVTGVADTIARINQYVDTLKFSEFVIVERANIREGQPKNQLKEFSLSSGSAFSNVVSVLNRRDDQASFTVTFNYSSEIFSVLGEKEDVLLIVPNIVTTRSETQRPANLLVEDERNRSLE